MSAVAQRVKRSISFRVSAELPALLEDLAERNYTYPSSLLELLIAGAVGVIVRGEPAGSNAPFIARVRELAAQTSHPRSNVVNSWVIGPAFVQGIRELQNGLALARTGLVVEYLVKAAASVTPDDGGEGDELERRRRAASYNLQARHPSPATLTRPLVDGRQLSLLKVVEEPPPRSE